MLSPRNSGVGTGGSSSSALSTAKVASMIPRSISSEISPRMGTVIRDWLGTRFRSTSTAIARQTG